MSIFTKLFSKKSRLQTVSDFINVRDINESYLYTKDGYIFTYLKLQPMTLDLLSKEEKKRKINRFASEFSNIRETFKFFATSRPVDISRTTHHLAEIMQGTENPYRKKILFNDIQAISNFALSGEVIQRQFYMIIWEKQTNSNPEKARDILYKRIAELKSKLRNCELFTEQVDETGIIQLCNLFTNPAYVYIENTDYGMQIPVVKEAN